MFTTTSTTTTNRSVTYTMSAIRQNQMNRHSLSFIRMDYRKSLNFHMVFESHQQSRNVVMQRRFSD